MATFEGSVTVWRPREAVFAFLMAAENNMRWQPTLVDSCAVTGGPLGVGWRFRECRRVFGRHVVAEFEVQRYEPPRFCEILAVSGLPPIRASYRLRVVGAGTLVTAAGEVPDHLLGRLAGCVGAHTARREVARNLQRLRDVLERTPLTDPLPAAALQPLAARG
jgi:hypothetical protein